MSKNVLIVFLVFFSFDLSAQMSSQQIKDLVYTAENRLKGKSSIAELKITTIRPKYSREMVMKTWTSGEDYSLMYVKEPARDRGTSYLKREKEIWYYIPSIERNIKMPPSMMNQSWMGTDLSNDDLVKKTSLANDFDHEFIGEENVNGEDCYRLKLIPHPEADIIWGKIELWIGKSYKNILRQESFDEDLELVNTMNAYDIKSMDGVFVPTRMEFIPADKPEQKTEMQYITLEFDVAIPPSNFTTQYMTRIKV
jgi:outer membrane lipoprotein-sorting protein